MTHQEAIKWIDGRVLELACLVNITNTDKKMQRINEEYNALLLARTVIYKQIPEEPAIKESEKAVVRFGESGVHKRTIYLCPVCERLLYIQNHFDYKDGFQRWPVGCQTQFCPTCGQALKWSAGDG